MSDYSPSLSCNITAGHSLFFFSHPFRLLSNRLLLELIHCLFTAVEDAAGRRAGR